MSWHQLWPQQAKHFFGRTSSIRSSFRNLDSFNSRWFHSSFGKFERSR